MTQPTPSEIVLLQNREQRTELYLSIYQPKTVFAAVVNDATIQVGARVISFDTVSTGAYTDIKSGMTMYIGSTPGGNNYGRIRIRSATATQITVAENSYINWKDNLYLTVKDFYEVWPIYQTLQQVGNTPATDEILVYKDADVIYAGQNDHPGSLVWMGSHKAAWMSGGSATLYWSATGTVNTEGAGMSYNWLFQGGSPSSGSSITPGNVTYNTAGHYVTQLNVTSSSGTTDVSYRYVSIYDDANWPVAEWGMDDLKGSRNEGSYTTSIWVRQSVNGVVEGALVILFSKSYYGSTPYSFVSNIEFVGYILNDSITYNYQDSRVEFSVGSVTEVMKGCEGPGVSLTSTPSPGNWSEMSNITIRKALWWFLRWHSTVLGLADVKYLGADFPIYAFETDTGPLFDVLADFFANTVIGTIASNRQGQIICEIDPAAIHNSTTVIPLGMRLDRMDWKDNPDIKEATRPEVSYMEMGGYVYVEGASTGTNTPYLSCAPGLVPSYFGKMEEHQGLALMSGQYILDALVGDVFAYKNARYPESTFSMAGNYGNIEFIPSERYLLTVEAADSQSRAEFTDLPFHPTELTWRYVPDRYVFSPNVVYHELVEGYSGTSLIIPTSPIPNNPPIPDVEYPPFIPITGTPFPPTIFIPPEPWDIDNCFAYNAPPTGPYLTFPSVTTLDTNHPSSDVYYPCSVRNRACLNSSYVSIDYTSADNSTDRIASIDVLGGGGILYTVSSYTVAGNSIFGQVTVQFNISPNLVGFTSGQAISGFRINLKAGTGGYVKDYSINLGDLEIIGVTITGHSDPLTTYAGDTISSFVFTGADSASWGWDWNLCYSYLGGIYHGCFGGEAGYGQTIWVGNVDDELTLWGNGLGGPLGAPIHIYGCVLNCNGSHWPANTPVNLIRVTIGNVCP